jgi:hypothetical protein
MSPPPPLISTISYRRHRRHAAAAAKLPPPSPSCRRRVATVMPPRCRRTAAANAMLPPPPTYGVITLPKEHLLRGEVRLVRTSMFLTKSRIGSSLDSDLHEKLLPRIGSTWCKNHVCKNHVELDLYVLASP